MVLNSGRAKEGKRGLSGPNEWVKSTQLNDFNFSTTSTYTNDAVSRSRQGANLITLVDGDELVDLLFEYRVSISEKTVVVINEKIFPKD